GVVVTVGAQPLGRLAPAVLGPVAESEQGLLAPLGRTLPGDVEDLVRGQERGVEFTGHGRERAVVATVAAQTGQGDEDLAAVGDHTGASVGLQARVAYTAGVVEQGLEVFSARVQEYLGLDRV